MEKLDGCTTPAVGAGLDSEQQRPVDAQFLEDVLCGLAADSKYLHCKYLYDQRGSKLFDMICELDEYYPTRVERQLTSQFAGEIGRCIGPGVVLVEYGSGSSTKTRVLLDHLSTPNAYLPVDISEDHLLDAARALQTEYPELDICPVVADFSGEFDLPARYADDRRCIYFPGSTIGNLEPAEAVLLLERIAWQVGTSGGLLVGFDLQKSVDVLELAYNDEAGVTAEFNLNLLQRINRELDGNFDLDQFAHVAYYNTNEHRIEIYIESLTEQTAQVAGESIPFSAGERICTEYSHKYTLDGFAELADQAGWVRKQSWTDADQYFGLMYLSVE